MSRMPRRAGLGCSAVLLSTALVLAGCGRAPDEEPVLTPVDTLCKAAAGDGPKVGIAYDVGGRNDRGINDSAFEGLSEAVDEQKGQHREHQIDDAHANSLRKGAVHAGTRMLEDHVW